MTNIQAAYLGIATQTSLTVQEKDIDNLQIIPHVNYLNIGEQVQLKCSIIYVDLSLGDCTNEALWTISDTSIAHIEPSSGLVTGLKSGTTRAFASYHGVTSKSTDGQVSVR
ncbi:MAG: Ig-like domain-containing protein, partial [Shewanella oncorhynchi]